MKMTLAKWLCPLFLLFSITEGFAKDVSFHSGIAEYDEAYLKALYVINSDIKNGKFLAGENWGQVWTRDTSYSIDLACKALHPDIAKNTLLGMTEQIAGIGKVWYQDTCGHFGGWPALTDAIVGAMGAWSLFEYTGDQDILSFSYEVTVNSLRRAERDAFEAKTGLFTGCSSFMESNSAYPQQYAFNGALLAKTKALSTNLLYFNGYQIAAKMAKLLNKDFSEFEEKSLLLKIAINKYFWMPEHGYYGYFQDENGKLYENMEATGEAFAILFGVADAAQSQSILQLTPMTAAGIPSLWPQFPEHKDYSKGFSEYYHNGMIWPFVQGYWALAASQSGDTAVFGRELEKLTRLSQKNDSFMEFYRPENSQPDGSRGQLWSASGYVSMIFHGLFGMNFQDDGIHFAPQVPKAFTTITLQDLTYRNLILDLTVKGSGNTLNSFSLDGVKMEEPRLGVDLSGKHSLVIEMR